MYAEIFAATDAGRVRKRNEDFFGVSEHDGLAIVCDGMGGHRRGDIASQTAVNAIETTFRKLRPEDLPASLQQHSDLPFEALKLIAAIQSANARLVALTENHSVKERMGTTVVALLLRDGFFAAAHVGDSRIYRFNREGLVQLTQDHAFESAAASRRRNMITRALGMEPAVEIDLLVDRLAPGDRFLLCSDGLSRYVPHHIVEEILLQNPSQEKAAARMIAAANAYGGRDNVTAVLASPKKPAPQNSDVAKIQRRIRQSNEHAPSASHKSTSRIGHGGKQEPRATKTEALQESSDKSAKSKGSKRKWRIGALAGLALAVAGFFFIQATLMNQSAENPENRDAAGQSIMAFQEKKISLVCKNPRLIRAAEVFLDDVSLGFLADLTGDIPLVAGEHILEIRWPSTSPDLQFRLNTNQMPAGRAFVISIDDSLKQRRSFDKMEMKNQN